MLGYVTGMFESLRRRASLLFLALTAFLLVLAQIPKWDSGWVQAIGSIAAILSGFAYVALQQHFARRELRRRENEMRKYVEKLTADAVETFQDRLTLFEDILEKGAGVRWTSARDPLDMAADEMLSITPNDLGSARLAIEVRKVGQWMKIVAHNTGQATAEAATTEVIDDAIEETQEAKEGVAEVLTDIRAMNMRHHQSSPICGSGCSPA